MYVNNPFTPRKIRQGKADFLLQPQSLKDLGLPEIFLANLILKHSFYLDPFTLSDLVERLKLSANILTPLLEYLQKEKCVQIRGADPFKPSDGSFSFFSRYSLTDGGKKRAAQLLEYDAYVGAVPVTLKDYWNQVERQSIRLTSPTPERMNQVFHDLVISSEIMEVLGPAVVSGKPLFLYGPSGNGKTIMALRLGQIWNDAILVPYAIFVEGNVIRVFDEITHRHTELPPSEGTRSDPRWVRCQRPVVVVGGELTLDRLELTFNSDLKYYEAPLQLKANNGMFLVDDLGRQKISPQDLLNRWIVPLENRQDFLCLNSGQKFAIPFDQFVVFATNLEPRAHLDEAFLRRIRSKVKVDYVDREQFFEIFRIICRQNQLEFDREAVEYLLTKEYDGGKRSFGACHPRDLVEQIIDYSKFYQLEPELTRENLDRACRNYFVN